MIIQNGDNNTKVQIFHRISYQIIESPLKFGNGYVISFQTLLDMWLLIHAGIKV